MAENDMVVMAFKREHSAPNQEGEIYTTTWFDMFRIEDGKLPNTGIMGLNEIHKVEVHSYVI